LAASIAVEKVKREADLLAREAERQEEIRLREIARAEKG